MKYYFITGTSRGIGKSLTEALIRRGDAKVIGISRSESITYERYRHVAADLADIGQLNALIPDIFPALPDAQELVLVNNAGTLGDIGYLGELNAAHYSQVLTLNVTAAAVLMDAFIKQYRNAACKKVILNVSSGAGKRPIDGWGAYCASKAALDMLTEVAAQELSLRGDQTRIYSVSPGVVDTEMQAQIREADESEFSSVARFKALYAEHELQNPVTVAVKLVQLIDAKHPYDEVQIRL